MNRSGVIGGLAVAAVLVFGTAARGDERSFAYVYEPDVLPRGGVEFEQWVSGSFGRDNVDFARWKFREEIEWGLTDRLTTALYLNFEDTFSSPKDHDTAPAKTADETGTVNAGLNFTGISSEWKYQVLSPYRYPVGLVAYLEGTTDGAHEHELEEKLILGTAGERWSSALNFVVEQEWERESGETEREGKLEVSAGLSRKLNRRWAVGVEALHARAYLDHKFSEREYTATFAGPNVHYATSKWWATLAVLPQVHGDGDGADGDLQLAHRERIETRLLAGINF